MREEIGVQGAKGAKHGSMRKRILRAAYMNADA